MTRRATTALALRARAHQMARHLRAAPACCEHCGHAALKLERHHPDYLLPLLVEWLCRPCHRKADALRALYERHGVRPLPFDGQDGSPVVPLDRIGDADFLSKFLNTAAQPAAAEAR